MQRGSLEVKQLVTTLRSFFSGEGVFQDLGLEQLPEIYVWPKKGEFPSFGTTSFEGTNYQKNIQLKDQFAGLWADNDHLTIAQWIIRDWGGIKTNKESTIANYVRSIEAGRYPSQLGGVASYSKILAFIEPDKYAIYDARVAASLNGIQLLQNVTDGVIWNNLPGRNSTIEKFKASLGGSTALRRMGWTRMKRAACYSAYNSVLGQALSFFPDYRLFHLEMSLFANAEIIVDRCLDSRANS